MDTSLELEPNRECEENYTTKYDIPSDVYSMEHCYILNQLIDFNGMSTYLGIFHILRLGNRVHCNFYVYIFV